MAQLLIEAGADVNSIDRGGLIPLHNAASYGHIEIAQLLLDAGSHVNANDRWQFTPLHEGITDFLFLTIFNSLFHGFDRNVC